MSTGVSRRSALRGAAWTATAVTVVVATPNIAAASVTEPPLLVGTLSGVTANPVKYNNPANANVKHVKWDLRFVNTGNFDLTQLRILCTFQEQSPTEITAFKIDSSTGVWSPTAGAPLFDATYTHFTGPVEDNDVVLFTPDFKGANNSKGTLKVEIFEGTTKLGEAIGTWKPA